MGQWRQAIFEEFADVFDVEGAPLKAMKGEPMVIAVRPGAIPTRITCPRPVPLPLRADAKATLDELQERGVIRPISTPTDWVHPMTCVRKPNGKLRLRVDLRGLNKYVDRPLHPIRPPREVIAVVPPTSRYFSTFDAASGYFQVPLAEESQEYTTFITPWGRFVHERATMGLSSSSDEYNRRGDAAVEGLEAVSKIVDDVLVFAKTFPEHQAAVRAFLERCREHSITLNRKKTRLGQAQVKFAGFLVGRDGVSADPAKLRAIREFPRPTNITDLRSFLGLVEQLAGFSREVAATMAPLRPLLSAKQPFLWIGDHDQAFEKTKAALLEPPVLATFDVTRDTRLETDAARTRGLGYALLQRVPTEEGGGEPGSEGSWRLVDAGSRFISETEARYATIELEMLAVRWAMKKCRLYLLGLPHFTLVVDHQPLKMILDHQTLDCVENPRLQRMKSELAPYLFSTEWQKGTKHRVPEALSRNPAEDPTPGDLEESGDLFGSVASVGSAAVAMLERPSPDEEDEAPPEVRQEDDAMLVQLRLVGDQDAGYRELRDAVLGAGEIPTAFSKVQEQLWVNDGLVMHGRRIVVPGEERKLVVRKLHAAHLGEERTLRRARQTVYWPGLTSDVRNFVRACEACQKLRPSQPSQKLARDAPASFAFQEIAADFGEIEGRHTLIIADRWSGFPAVYPVVGYPTSQKAMDALLLHFAMFGAPLRFFSDGATVFVSEEFQRFLKEWGIRHRVSTAGYPQSNGLAEVTVKVMKHLLYKTGGTATSPAFLEGMLAYRLTPRDGGRSPSEMVFGQSMRSKVPMATAARLAPAVTAAEHEEKAASLADLAKARHDRRAAELAPLSKGDRVRVQSLKDGRWNKLGTISRAGPHRDYWVVMDQGGKVFRNRKFLRPLAEATDLPGEPIASGLEEGPRRSARVTGRPRSYRE